jgi:hypothetical protein
LGHGRRRKTALGLFFSSGVRDAEMQSTEYADFSREKFTLHVQRKPWRHFRVKGKKKKKSAKDSFISIPALGWLCGNLEKIRDGRDVRILRRRQSPPFRPATDYVSENTRTGSIFHLVTGLTFIAIHLPPQMHNRDTVCQETPLLLTVANTGSFDCLPRGRTAVTPVRTGPFPTSKGLFTAIRVACPTSTPFTSVMALSAPGVPSKGMPRSRARGLF